MKKHMKRGIFMSSNKNSRSSYHGPRGRRDKDHTSKRLHFDYDRPKRKPIKGGWIPFAAAGAVVVLLGISAVVLHSRSVSEPERAAKATASQASETSPVLLTVNGISLEGLSKDEAVSRISKSLSWNMTAAYEDDSKELPNILTDAIRNWLTSKEEETVSGDLTLTAAELPTDALKNSISQELEELAKEWDVPSKISTLDHYDNQKGQFVFREGCAGSRIDRDQLANDILAAIHENRMDAVVEVQSHKEAPSISCDEVKASYKTLVTFTTETTDNDKRNTNVRLAAEALNGTIVQPGEEFSFNSVVGQRTAEKGYQEAAAYNSGAVVQELGGGVCQISSTLYRVVFQSGMEVTFRRSHTFEPNYVTPGQDAAISWEQPDFRFVNTSDKPIGILASYADRKATVSIFGVPVLEDGVVWDLASEKVEEIDPPEPEYVEDPTLAPGTENTIKAATKGSRWDTYKVVYKDGQEVERTLDHSKTYLGHSAVIHRNTSSASGTTTSGTTTSDTTASSTKGAQESSSVANPTKAAAPTKAGTTEKKAPKHETAPAQTAPAPTEMPVPPVRYAAAPDRSQIPGFPPRQCEKSDSRPYVPSIRPGSPQETDRP